jgi:RDD family protein
MTDRELQQKRIVAAVIDIGIAFVIWGALAMLTFILTMAFGGGSSDSMGWVTRVLGLLNSVVGLGYVLGRDILGGDRSVGKKIQNIRVVTTTGAGISFMESARRNAIFAIGSVLGLLSAVLGLVPCLGDAVNCMLFPLYILGFVASVGAAIFEIIKITSDPEGVRLGDQMASTRVVR